MNIICSNATIQSISGDRFQIAVDGVDEVENVSNLELQDILCDVNKQDILNHIDVEEMIHFLEMNNYEVKPKKP